MITPFVGQFTVVWDAKMAAVSLSWFMWNCSILLAQLLIEGDIGGFSIPQYRKKKWQIPKYRVENRLNTDTAYFNQP